MRKRRGGEGEGGGEGVVEVEGLMMERDWRDQCHELLKQARSKSDVLKVTTKREMTWEGERGGRRRHDRMGERAVRGQRERCEQED